MQETSITTGASQVWQCHGCLEVFQWQHVALQCCSSEGEECSPYCSQGSLPIEEEPCEVCRRKEE
jgi:hypothetical protein